MVLLAKKVTKALFRWRIVVVLTRWVTRLPELPWASYLFICFVTKPANYLHEKQNVHLARRMTIL